MTGMHLPLRLVLATFGWVIVLLHVLGLIFPSGVNWGFHHLAFLPPVVSVPIIILMVAALVPQVQEQIFTFANRVLGTRKGILWTAIVAVSGLFFWLLRQQTFFLGDGYLVIRNLSLVRSVEDIPAPFPTAPLSAYLAYHVRELLGVLHLEPAARLAWQIQSMMCGLVAIPLTVGLARTLTHDRPSKWPVALFLLAGGALQLFFGYVETYPPAYVTTILFLWLSLRYLKGEGSFLFPLLSFGLLFTFHFGMLSLVPAVCVLLVVELRKRKVASAAAALAATLLFVPAVLWICGYTPRTFLSVVTSGGSYFLPLAVHDNWQAAYSLISLWHWVDLFNAYMLLSPFAFILVPFGLMAALRPDTRGKPETIFLGLGLLGAVAWTFMTNFEVGMSRDWDVIAPLSVCVLAFAVLGLFVDDRRHVLVVGMALVTLLHTAAWIAVNSDENRSIARYAMLQDSRVRSQRAIAYACEDLAGFYRDRKQYAEALPFMEKTVAIDSTNARRWLSLANVYQLDHREGDAIHAYEESIHYGIHDKAAFFNLGVLYYNHHRPDDAVTALTRASALDPADTLVSSTLRLMESKKAEER